VTCHVNSFFIWKLPFVDKPSYVHPVRQRTCLYFASLGFFKSDSAVDGQGTQGWVAVGRRVSSGLGRRRSGHRSGRPREQAVEMLTKSWNI
jgi:hypothetical protein